MANAVPLTSTPLNTIEKRAFRLGDRNETGLLQADKTRGHISSEISKPTSIYLLSGMLDEKLYSLINRPGFFPARDHGNVFVRSGLLPVLNDSTGA